MSEPALDPRALEQLRQLGDDDGSDVLGEVLRLFADDAPRRIETIAQAVADGGGAALQRAAHGLKGASATVGALTMRDICRALEQLGRSGVNDGADAQLRALQSEFARVNDTIARMLGNR